MLLLQVEAIWARQRYVEGFYEVGSWMNVLLFCYDARSWMGIAFCFHGCLRLRERREFALPKMWVTAWPRRLILGQRDNRTVCPSSKCCALERTHRFVHRSKVHLLCVGGGGIDVVKSESEEVQVGVWSWNFEHLWVIVEYPFDTRFVPVRCPKWG